MLWWSLACASMGLANSAVFLSVGLILLGVGEGGGGSDYVDFDVEFHLASSQCAKNQMLFELLSPIRGVLAEWISKSQKLPGIQENAHRQHISRFLPRSAAAIPKKPGGSRSESAAANLLSDLLSKRPQKR